MHLSICFYLWRAFFQNTIYKIDNGIFNPCFRIALNAFWKRTLHMYRYTNIHVYIYVHIWWVNNYASINALKGISIVLFILLAIWCLALCLTPASKPSVAAAPALIMHLGKHLCHLCLGIFLFYRLRDHIPCISIWTHSIEFFSNL